MKDLTITINGEAVYLGAKTPEGDVALVLDKGQALNDVVRFLDAVGWKAGGEVASEPAPCAPRQKVEREIGDAVSIMKRVASAFERSTEKYIRFPTSEGGSTFRRETCAKALREMLRAAEERDEEPKP